MSNSAATSDLTLRRPQSLRARKTIVPPVLHRPCAPRLMRLFPHPRLMICGSCEDALRNRYQAIRLSEPSSSGKGDTLKRLGTDAATNGA